MAQLTLALRIERRPWFGLALWTLGWAAILGLISIDRAGELLARSSFRLVAE
jgi:hypothetical protein